MDKLLLVLSLILPGVIGVLPTSFDATSYDLSLTVPSDITSTVVGSVTIKLTCKTDTPSIFLHWGSSLTPTQPSATELQIKYTAPSTSTEVDITGFTTSVDLFSQLNITTTTQFSAGGIVTITAKFQTKINSDNKGLFYRQYQVESGQNNTILLSNLRPTFARELFPCLDEPSFSGQLTLTLIYPSSWSSAATTITQSSIPSTTTGLTTTVFSPISLPPNNLALFLAQNMVQTIYSVDRSSTKLSFWSRRSLASSVVLNANIQFLAGYYYMVEDTLGTNLPLPQLTVVMVPGLEEAFASYGVIFIREDNYAQDYSNPQTEGLFKANVAPVVYQFLRQFTEFSTRPSSWSDYWISQAIAKYLQYLILNTVMPIFDFKTDLEVVARQTALSVDSQSDTKPLQDTSVSIDLTSSVQALISDPLKGLKGAAILNMLDQSLPAGAVFAVIKAFLINNKNTLISTNTFISAIQGIASSSPGLSDRAKLALSTTLSYWIGTTRYPLETVSIVKTGTTGVVNFTTTGFCSALNPSCSTALPGGYYVSATVGSKSDNRYYAPRQDLWVSNSDTYMSTSTSINIQNNDWVVANMKSGGYYRSNYDTENWLRIINAITSKDQYLLGRTQLLDDAFALSFSSVALDFNITVRLALANLGNTQYKDWVPVQRGLRTIRNNLFGQGIYQSYQNFAAGYFLNLNQYLQNTSSDAFEKARIQALFLDEMCEFDITGFRASALVNLTSLLRGSLPNTVPSSAYDTLACCGARYNSTLKAQFLWNILADSTQSYYSRRFAAIALGCMSNYTDVAQFFNTMTATNIQLKPYIKIALENLAEKNPVNFLEDVSALADKFQSQLGGASVASLISLAGRKVNNSTQAAVLENLENNANVDAVVRTAASSTRSIVKYKVTWLETNSQRLVSTLKTYTLPSGTTSGANILTAMSLLILLPSLVFTFTPITA